MQGRILSRSSVFYLIVATLALVSTLASLASFNVAQAHTLDSVASHAVNVHPQYVLAGKAQPNVTFGCQQAAAAVHCYGPQQIRNAYNVQAALNAGITGKGRTIVIVDAFQSPTIANDLHVFDQTFGLNDSTLNIIAPDGLTPFDQQDANQVGWAGEITLDVEWAHAIAPDATIDLVLAKSNQDADLLSVTKFAVDHNLGDVISQSFGEAESCVDPNILKQEHQVFFEATLKHITLLASSGDQGAAQPTCDGNSFLKSVSSPASDPFVTAVGGTQLFADLTTGAYQSEVTWNEPMFFAGTGGGFSTIFHKPFYQIGTAGIGQFRGVPDISYNAAINGGVLAVWSTSGAGPNQVFLFGGTSAGSPQWAGITALGSQMAHRRLGFLNLGLYILGHTGFSAKTFHDITVGNNTFTFPDANGNNVTITGFDAKKGWDASTGWGSPNVAQILPFLAQLTFPGDDARTMSQLQSVH